jgi:beta-N-acetylhexosaminidase
MKRLLLILILSNFLFAQTDLRHKITQMLIVGFPGTSLTDTTIINDIQKKQVGGVILFAQNITSLLQVQQLNNSLQSLSQVPLFISVDEEGGRVARLKASNGFENTFTAYQIGTIFNNADTTISWADLMGGWLSESKFNIDLAPVVDVDVNPTSPAIGYLDRSFSRIPDTVFFHSNLFISELHKKNIFTTLKHFPGHGSATSDSHDGFTDITSTWADSELVPYRKLIQNGYNDFIMSGHLFNANLDSTYPASLSYKVLTGLLRDSLKYNGLIITDGMFMGAITDNYSFDEAVTLAINAGNDILLYTTNVLNGESLVDSVVNIVIDKISKGIITENRIDESYNRIMLKKQLLTNVEYIASKVIPDDFNLVNYPNPFNSTTQIMFTISRSGMISLKIFNILGEEIKEIANQYFDAGTHKISFNADLLSSGVYLIRMNLEGNYSSHKIILMK